MGPLKRLKSDSHCNIKFSTNPFKCLGIYIGHDKNRCEELNWQGKMTKIEELLKAWSKRKLTLFGKAIVINTLAIPKIIYNCAVLSVPEHIIVKVEKMVSHFLWYGKNRINCNCVISSIENGGLNIVDIRSKIKSLKAGWIIWWTKNAIWSPIAESYVNKIGGNFKLFLQMNVARVSELPPLSDLPKCYQDIWLSFYECEAKISN